LTFDSWSIIYYGVPCGRLYDKKESADIYTIENLFAHLKSLTEMKLNAASRIFAAA